MAFGFADKYKFGCIRMGIYQHVYLETAFRTGTNDLTILTVIIINSAMAHAHAIHTLSMALVWLYHGFAMNGQALKDGW